MVKRILLIDDSPQILTLYYDVLTAHGFNVITANNGQAGIVAAQKQQPDLILLDVVMPGIDGPETSQQLLADPKTANIPVMFMTSMITEQEEVAARGQGGRAFISKGSEPSEIVKKVRQALGM
jgi:twitching motility two-component system response regulator PilH